MDEVGCARSTQFGPLVHVQHFNSSSPSSSDPKVALIQPPSHLSGVVAEPDEVNIRRLQASRDREESARALRHLLHRTFLDRSGAQLNLDSVSRALTMYDYKAPQPSDTTRCDFDSDNHLVEQLEPGTDGALAVDFLRLAPVSTRERRGIPERTRYRQNEDDDDDDDDEEEEIFLSCGDRTDSGIDVLHLETPVAPLAGKYTHSALLPHSNKTPRRRGHIDPSKPASKHPLQAKLVESVESRVSALLLSLEKVRISCHRSPGQRPTPALRSITKAPEYPSRQLPKDAQDRNNVNIGGAHKYGGAGGSHPASSNRGLGSSRTPPDDDDIQEHGIYGDPKQSFSSDDLGAGFPCIFHKIGSVDPTPGCAWPRQYTSQLRSHHFHSNHPGGPFGCCSRCFESGCFTRAHNGPEEWHRFTNRAEAQSHEKNCTRSVCIEETCHNFDQVPSTQFPCSHGARFTQKQIWRMWYRRAHSLTRTQAVPDLVNRLSQNLRPPSAALERTQSSPGDVRRQALSTTTPALATNANASPPIADPRKSYTPMASGSTTPVLLAAKSTREALTELASGLLHRMQTDLCEPGVVLRQTCERMLNDSAKLQHDLLAINPEDGNAIELLHTLLEECLRLLTVPMKRTPIAWFDLALAARVTLGVKISTQPPANWVPVQQDFLHTSTTSSFDGTGVMFDTCMSSDPQQQQQQEQPHDQQHQQHRPLLEMMMENPETTMSVPTITFSDLSPIAQVGGAFTSQPANSSNLGLGDHNMWHIMNVSHEPYDPNEGRYSGGNIQPPTYDRFAQAQPPLSMTSGHLPLPVGNAYLRSVQGHAPVGLMPAESDAQSVDASIYGDSGVFSTTQSMDSDMGREGNEKGKGPADGGVSWLVNQWQGGIGS
ncbi:hypothetical protein CERZMDRAFT_85605 [Cercospora zeae-maydis SCOH1-5]|uniref:Uncharacterized protein n=1 Tax=Cercospora zeae-maydis SCOH1-5 TaxID=717836 RepID=A0A6A6FCB7_9PEZI|nr:hypothetical protein CERZMDRAFT_85605 [Cercospora zeae-maydis SCOH1-5]